MSSNFAVVGAGAIGAWIIDELLNHKASGAVNTLKILSRSETIKSSNPKWFAKGAEFTQADYADEAALAGFFEGIDVVFSTINATVVEQQQVLARIAKAAGVKLFVPSEYGIDTENATDGVFLAKKRFSEFLREIDLPYVKIFTGLWTDYCITPSWGWQLDDGKATIGGIGDSPLSFVHRTDIARYVGYVFTHIPPSELAWKILRIEAERTTFNKIAAGYEAKTGKKLEITRTPREVLAKKADDGDLMAFLFHEWDLHGGTVGSPLTNDLYPDWNPRSVIDAITQ